MAKQTKKAAKVETVELTPEQKAAQAKSVALYKLLGAHPLLSTAFEVETNVLSLQREIDRTVEDAEQASRYLASGYFNSVSAPRNHDRMVETSARAHESLKGLLMQARATVAAHEGALALGANIQPADVVVLVTDSNEWQRVVAILPASLDAEFEVARVAFALALAHHAAVYIREA